MMVTLIDRFNVRYIDLRNTLSNAPANYKDFWANEIHPSAGGIFEGKDGWGAIAAKFQTVLAKLP